MTVPVCYCVLAATVLVTLIIYVWQEPRMPSIRIEPVASEPFRYGYRSSWGDNVSDGAVWGTEIVEREQLL